MPGRIAKARMKVDMAAVNRNVAEWLALTPKEKARYEALVKSRVRKGKDGTLTVGHHPEAGNSRG